MGDFNKGLLPRNVRLHHERNESLCASRRPSPEHDGRAHTPRKKTHQHGRAEQHALLPPFVARGVVEMRTSRRRPGSEPRRIHRPFAVRQYVARHRTLASQQIVCLGYRLEPRLSDVRGVLASDGGVWVVDADEVIVYMQDVFEYAVYNTHRVTDIVL